MGVEARIYNTLSNATAVTGIVDERIYPDHRPQNGSLPAVVFTRVPGGERINSLDGYALLENVVLEVAVLASAVDARRAAADEVVAALTASTWFSCILPDPPYDEYDDETGIYERTLLFSIWNQTT